MNRFGIFVIGFALGCAAMFMSHRYQIVRAHDGLHMVPKMTSQLLPLYVDVRNYTAGDWLENHQLALEITKANKAYIMRDSAMQPLREATQPFRDAVDSTVEGFQ